MTRHGGGRGGRRGSDATVICGTYSLLYALLPVTLASLFIYLITCLEHGLSYIVTLYSIISIPLIVSRYVILSPGIVS